MSKAKNLLQSLPEAPKRERWEADGFKPDQIDQLKAEYDKIDRVDPGSPTYKKLIALLDKMDQATLQQVADAGIKFVSKLALNRVKRHEGKEDTRASQFLTKVRELATYKHGFDLTSFNSPHDWEKVLAAAGIKKTAATKDKEGVFTWTGSGILIVTGNDPITGEWRGPSQRDKEPGYASYIGLEGEKETVMKAVAMIKKLGDIKDESPGSRDFI